MCSHDQVAIINQFFPIAFFALSFAFHAIIYYFTINLANKLGGINEYGYQFIHRPKASVQ